MKDVNCARIAFRSIQIERSEGRLSVRQTRTEGRERGKEGREEGRKRDTNSSG